MNRKNKYLQLYCFIGCILSLSIAARAQDTLGKAGSRSLEAVTISAEKPLIERKVDKTVMNIANSALATGNNALEVLARVPGVTVDLEGNIAMRGKGGVSILIDSRQTYLSGTALADLLKAIQGSNIQSIELITNPSARYDASGTAGIINIVLKKDRSKGTNGSASFALGRAHYFKENAGLLLNHSDKWFTIYGSYNYNNDKIWRDLQIDRTSKDGLVTTLFNQETKIASAGSGSSWKTGLDLFQGKSNTLSFMVSGNGRNGNDESYSTTVIGSKLGSTDSIVKANNPARKTGNNIAYNINFKSRPDTSGQELTIDLNRISYHNTQDNDYNNDFYSSAGANLGMPVVFRSSAPSSIRIYAGQADYTYPFGPETKLEAGIKSSFVHTTSDFLFSNFNTGGWENDSIRSNRFIYDENINAAYLNFSHSFKKTAIQIGLRAEQTNSKGNSPTVQQVVEKHYANLFPALFLHRPIDDNHEFNFSCSRKIDRPNYASLNPFVTNFDLYTVGKGNPFLNPQYTNIAELSYTYKKNLNITLAASQTSHAITEVTLPDTLNKTLYVQNQNLASLQSYSLNISTPLKITGWWHTENNATVFYNQFRTPDLLGANFSSSRVAVNINSYQTFTVNSTASFELSLLYLSARVQGTYLFAPLYRADIGFKKSFLQKRASLKLGIDDLFNTHKERLSSTIPGQEYKIYQKYDTRVFKIACSYRLGSNTIRESRQRNRSSSLEETRAGG